MSVADGWDDDDVEVDLEDDHDDDENENESVEPGLCDETSGQQQQQQQQQTSNSPDVDDEDPALFMELCRYMELLPHTRSSVNAILEADFNTPQKALELVDYYASRPGLVDYTLRKELPRLDYAWMDDTEGLVTNKRAVADALEQVASRSLIPRCANQSLLADLLHAMTGHDLLIRPQYMATAIATKCRFLCHPDSVLVKAELDLLLPLESDDQERSCKLATLSVSCQLVLPPPSSKHKRPPSPLLCYRLEQIRPNDALDLQDLKRVARLLRQLGLPEIMDHDQEDHRNSHAVRDAFLSNTRSGLEAAWREINVATRIGQRWAAAKHTLFQAHSHTNQVLEQAEAEEEEMRRQQEELRRQQQQEQQQQPVASSVPRSGPPSILGGMLRSGLSRLAQTVALPEEDESMYSAWRQPHEQEQESADIPPSHAFPRPPPEAQSSPASNHASSSLPASNNIAGTAVPPPLSERPASPVAAPTDDQSNAVLLPAVSHDDDDGHVPDGWGLDDEDEDVIVFETEESSVPAQETTTSSAFVAPAAHYDDDDSNDMEESPPAAPVQQPVPAAADSVVVETTTPPTAASDAVVIFEEEESTTTSSSQLRPPLTSTVMAATLRMMQPRQTTANNPDWVYDPKTDIIPTRQRWVNPLPGPRRWWKKSAPTGRAAAT